MLNKKNKNLMINIENYFWKKFILFFTLRTNSWGPLSSKNFFYFYGYEQNLPYPTRRVMTGQLFLKKNFKNFFLRKNFPRKIQYEVFQPYPTDWLVTFLQLFSSSGLACKADGATALSGLTTGQLGQIKKNP